MKIKKFVHKHLFKTVALVTWTASALLWNYNIHHIGTLIRHLPINQKKVVCVDVEPGTAVMPQYYSEKSIERVYRISKGSAKMVMDSLKTPEEASIYCTYILNADGSDSLLDNEDLSFSLIHQRKSGSCRSGTIAAAAILKDNGFQPYCLNMDGEQFGHVVFLYRDQDSLFGSVGINQSDIRSPLEKSVNDLVAGISYSSGHRYTNPKIRVIPTVFPNYDK